MTKKKSKDSVEAYDKIDPEMRRSLMADALEQHIAKPDQVFQWIKNLNDICGDILLSGEKSAFLGRFWVRLYGVMLEVTEYYEALARDMKGVQEIGAFEAVCKALRDLRGSFTDEEIIVIMYERDCESHVFQHSYYLDIKKSGEVKEHRGVNVLRRDIPIKEIMRIVRNKIQEVSLNEKLLAVNFARKVERYVPPILSAIEALPGEVTIAYPQ